MLLLQLFYLRMCNIFENTFLSNPANKIAGFTGIMFGILYGWASLYFSEAPSFVIYALYTLGIVIVCDTIAGSILAIKERSFCLTIARASIAKITVYTVSLVVLIPIGYLIVEIGVTSDRYMLLGIMAAYLASIEIMSFMRLTKELGVQWPSSVEGVINAISKDLDSDMYIDCTELDDCGDDE